MANLIEYKKFSSINIDDPFFDSLKEDYLGFEDWFKRKADEYAYVLYGEDNLLQGFLYLKDESNEVDEKITPIMGKQKRLKVGTFKIDAHRTRLGEKFIKKIMDTSIYGGYKEVYVTIYPKHSGLVNLLKKYGFIEYGHKGKELVLVKSFTTLKNEIPFDYPMINKAGHKKYMLSVYPKFHTKLFSDSILRNEERNSEDLVKDVSFSNSIHKIYICFMSHTVDLERGDLLVIYRTTDHLGPARYRSVITSICQVEEVKCRSDFSSMDQYLDYAKSYSVFSEDDLRKWFYRENLAVIKMTYNIALCKKVTRGMLLDNTDLSSNDYWGFMELSDSQFDYILKEGKVNENFIVD